MNKTAERVARIRPSDLTGLHRPTVDYVQEGDKRIAVLKGPEKVWAVESDFARVDGKDCTRTATPEGVRGGFANIDAYISGKISNSVNIATTAFVGDATVGECVIVDYAAIICDGAWVERYAKVGHNTIVEGGAIVGQGAELSANLRIKSGDVIPAHSFVTEDGELLDRKPLAESEIQRIRE